MSLLRMRIKNVLIQISRVYVKNILLKYNKRLIIKLLLDNIVFFQYF